MSVKGTNISNETSLVKSMDEKKTSSTRKRASLLLFEALISRAVETRAKSPESFSPSLTPIRQKSRASVLKSIASE